ncbi:hypothetical protein K7X08_011169 [Anisodus acutangulus]|uniref:Uncharacterized protein n=1 Tax=Anisodus acutangulus TaxID=402998 RepID=A0A9Q1M1V2_9SOLA|nr:hypothetical protein K7X08_011169 [Anisodus acutangulus]
MWIISVGKFIRRIDLGSLGIRQPITVQFQEEPFLLAVGDLDAVFSTEVDIAGAKSRMTSASLLKSAWVNASREMNMKALDLKVADSEVQSLQTAGIVESQSILLAEGSLLACMRAGFNILNERTEEQPGIIIVTGSLHIVSAVLGYFHS